MTAVDPKAAMHDLMGAVCPCGAAKERRRPFCLPCFQRVPRDIRHKLAGMGKSEYITTAYPEIYASALDSLKLESPFLSAQGAEKREGRIVP